MFLKYGKKTWAWDVGGGGGGDTPEKIEKEENHCTHLLKMSVRGLYSGVKLGQPDRVYSKP